VPDRVFLFWVVYGVAAAVFMALQNRRPQATFAWLLLFIAVPALGILIYIFFGRDQTGFRRGRRLVRQDLHPGIAPTVARILDGQEEIIRELEAQKPEASRLLGLVRRSGHSTMTTRNRVEVLQDAAEKYPRLFDDLRAARRSIHLQYYVWGTDDFTEELKAVLVERARAGVAVRILYDPFGSYFRLKRRYIRALVKAGAQVAPSSKIYLIHTLTYRNHRKIAVIDGRAGYAGGLNIGKEHLDGGGAFPRWRDTHIRVEGEAAMVLQAVFAIDWRNATGEQLNDPDLYPPIPPELEDARLPVQIVTSGPDSEFKAIRRQYFSMIMAAKKRIIIQSPFFILDETINEALKTAALAGIDVEVMLSAKGFGNWLPYWAANTYVADVAKAGVRVFLYEAGYMHAKVAVTDGEICSIGSANMDIRSFSINYELNAVIYSKPIAARLEADFRRDLAGCREFRVSDYRKVPLPLRLRDSTARLFSPLL
jgi:cardiolipin synthase